MIWKQFIDTFKLKSIAYVETYFQNAKTNPYSKNARNNAKRTYKSNLNKHVFKSLYCMCTLPLAHSFFSFVAPN